MKNRLKRVVANVMAISLVLVALGVQSNTAFAATVTEFSDNMSTLKTSTLANHDIFFKTTATGALGASATIVLTFPSGFTIGSVAFGDIDLQEESSGSGLCTARTYTGKTLVASGPTTTQWSASFSGQVLTFTGGSTASIGASKCVRIKIGTNAADGGAGTNRITNHASAANYSIGLTTSGGDVGTDGIILLTTDQVNVTATVNPTLTFTISQTAIDYGPIVSGTTRFATAGAASGGSNTTTTASFTLAAGTNAASGYALYILGDVLTSGPNTITGIGTTATAPNTTIEQFGLNLAQVAASGGSGTASAPYSTNGSYAYPATATTQNQIASAAGATATTTYTVSEMANIATNTEAGSYTTTQTLTATASF